MDTKVVKKTVKKVKQEFVPSKYQEAIYEHIEKGQGHLVVEAAAGSGKTYTLVKCVDLIPDTKRILLTAFNTDIVDELRKKVGVRDNVDIRTLHSLGLAFIRRNVEGDYRFSTEVYKYRTYLRNNLKFLTSNTRYKLGKKYNVYIDNIMSYINYGRCYLIDTVKGLDFIEERYDIPTVSDEKEVAIEVMEWGKTEFNEIDYTDMIWLPNVLDMKPKGFLFDWVMVDECQDLNKAERQLLLKCHKMGTRMISVGDSNQMLYSFAGGDIDSFKMLKEMPNTKSLPLSISYRCARKIVENAKKVVSSIEPNDDGREGKILRNVRLEDVQDGDMVLCRNNAPLLDAYNRFLQMGRKATIRGKDIGSNLKTLIRSTGKKDLCRDLNCDGVFVRLYDELFAVRDEMMGTHNISEEEAYSSSQFESRYDKIQALEVLSEGIYTTDELINRIDTIFPKAARKTEGVSLSTIHKAKGLEADNVYILCESILNGSNSKLKWEKIQEQNLKYVAYTRSKNVLGFIDEKELGGVDNGSMNTIKHLKFIEKKVNMVLGKTTKVILNEEDADEIIRRIKSPDLKQYSSVTIDLSKINSSNRSAQRSLSEIFKKRRGRKW